MTLLNAIKRSALRVLAGSITLFFMEITGLLTNRPLSQIQLITYIGCFFVAEVALSYFFIEK